MHSATSLKNSWVIAVHDRCEDIEDAWRHLEATGAATPFQSYAFTSILMETVGRAQGAIPRIVLVKDHASEPQMIIPLVLVDRAGVTVLTFPDFKVSDYFAPVFKRSFAEAMTPPRFLDLWASIEKIVGPFDLVELPKMPSVVEGVPNPLLALPSTIHETAFETDLSEGLMAFRNSLSKRQLSTLGRKRRNLERNGTVRYSPVRTREEASRIVAKVIELKSKRYRSTGVKDLFVEPAYDEFYTKLAEAEWDGVARMAALYFDDEPISMSFDVRRGERICMLMPAFDEERFRRESIGILYIQDTLAWCSDNGFRVLDYTWGDEAYKFFWSNRQTPLYRIRYAVTFRGRLHCARLNGLERTRRLLKSAAQGSPVLMKAAKGLRKRINDATSTRHPSRETG